MSRINPDVTLQDMGLDSMTGVEVKQTLDRDYDISMSANEIRELTFAKIDAMQVQAKPQQAAKTHHGGDLAASASSGACQEPAKPVHYELRHLCPSDAVVEMNAADAGASSPLFVIPPIEGSVFILSQLMSKVKAAKVYGLQCTKDAPLSSLPDLASHYIKVDACFRCCFVAALCKSQLLQTNPRDACITTTVLYTNVDGQCKLATVVRRTKLTTL